MYSGFIRTVCYGIFHLKQQAVAGLILHYPYFVVPPAFGGDGKTGVVEDVFDRIARYHGKVLIFNGDKDKYVHLEYTQKAAEAYDDAELVVMEGSGHGFGGEARDRVKSLMVSFVSELSVDRKTWE